MITTENFNEIIQFRIHLLRDYQLKKISAQSFANRSYLFFRQKRLKFIKKAHDINSVIFNYYFWTARIERRVYIERELSEYGCSSAERLEQIISIFIRRRNQMVRRLLHEFDDVITIEYAKIVFDDLVEVKIKEFALPFYCNKEVLDRIKIDVLNIEKSTYEHYLPFLNYKIYLNSLKK